AVRSPSEPPDWRPTLGDAPEPRPRPGEVLIGVHAAGLNHADLLQLRGLYPPPAGESDVLGLECAGIILETGDGGAGFHAGERVMALLAGGGQAERVAAPAGQVMRLPAELNFEEGAAVPEAGLTAWTNLVAEGGLRAGETVLITGATGGMGTMAVMVAKALGARVLAAGREQARLEALRPLGADGLCVLGDGLREQVRSLIGGAGVDLVLDLVGGRHTSDALGCLRPRGRLVLVGLLAGRRAEVDLDRILTRRLTMVGSVLRPRPREEKARLVAAFADFALPLLASGKLRAVVDRVFPFEQVAPAYALLAAGGAAGKIVLKLPSPPPPT
ncbi:MAG TPA: NAD(P)H-quinone oxidoreductase, partial [Thermoanaerobaculia bacterium]|nr:NAD(P)H-quinone oxidoreductase [Thermoanaerobaculia bacterium]